MPTIVKTPEANSPTSPKPVPTGHTVNSWWRATAYALMVLIAIGTAATMSLSAQFQAQIAHLQTQLQQTAQIRDIAVLLDDKASPALLVTLDPQEGALQLQRLNAVKEGREDSMQLWALRTGAPAQSLGVLQGKAATLRLAITPGALNGAMQLAISVEDKGGVDNSKGPRLPYLFQGALVQKAL